MEQWTSFSSFPCYACRGNDSLVPHCVLEHGSRDNAGNVRRCAVIGWVNDFIRWLFDIEQYRYKCILYTVEYQMDFLLQEDLKYFFDYQQASRA